MHGIDSNAAGWTVVHFVMVLIGPSSVFPHGLLADYHFLIS